MYSSFDECSKYKIDNFVPSLKKMAYTDAPAHDMLSEYVQILENEFLAEREYAATYPD